ncbi:hypothetical protein Syun_029253 [Stephania yunnanensis]|uniref:RING-type domain-containing protein n=1 Tax=Stephania yunnanensis TaxID=152371 RepID=A0AAP0ED96_9MAGN
MEGLPSTRSAIDIPAELHCPLCKGVMKDVVMTGKCCYRSFCDKCIRDCIISKSMCACGATNILADDLVPNKNVRDLLESCQLAKPPLLSHSADLKRKREIEHIIEREFGKARDIHRGLIGREDVASSKLASKISAASVGIRACFSVIGEIMPPKRNQQRIEEVYDRNNLNRQIGPLNDQRMVAVVEQLTARIDQLLGRHMDRILPFERTDSVGSAGRWRDSHHGSREFVRWGSEDLRRPSGRSKQGDYQLSSVESSRGFAPSRAGKRSAEEESGFRPSALRGGDGKYYARGGHATKGSFSQRDWRGGHGSEQGGHGSEQGRQHDVTVQTPVHEFDDSGSKATPRKRLVKKSGDRERTPDFGIEDEEPAFMRDEFASEPPSSPEAEGVEGRWV